ncbi:MAG: hypothetical protein V3U87_01060 [Methylococcaceae bacterium]
MLAADRKKRHNFCEKKKPQKLRPFLRQLKQALCVLEILGSVKPVSLVWVGLAQPLNSHEAFTQQ